MSEVKDFTVSFSREDCYDGFVDFLNRLSGFCVGITLLDGTFLNVYVEKMIGDEKLLVAPFGKGLEGSTIFVNVPEIKEVRYN